jgi:hypothetical protein
MQSKFTGFLILSFLFAPPIQAGPIHWIKNQFREHPTRTAFVLGIGAATVHGIGLEHCRQGSVENCEAKYGAAWLSYTTTTMLNFAVIGASNSCRKQDGGQICNALAYGGSAFQTGFGISQWRNKNSETQK